MDMENNVGLLLIFNVVGHQFIKLIWMKFGDGQFMFDNVVLKTNRQLDFWFIVYKSKKYF